MAGFELPACLQAAFVVVAGNQERERAFKSVIMSVLAVRWPTVFSTDRAGVCMTSLVLNPAYCFPREE